MQGRGRNPGTVVGTVTRSSLFGTLFDSWFSGRGETGGMPDDRAKGKGSFGSAISGGTAGAGTMGGGVTVVGVAVSTVTMPAAAEARCESRAAISSILIRSVGVR